MKLFHAEILMLYRLTLSCELNILIIWIHLEWHSRCLITDIKLFENKETAPKQAM